MRQQACCNFSLPCQQLSDASGNFGFPGRQLCDASSKDPKDHERPYRLTARASRQETTTVNITVSSADGRPTKRARVEDRTSKEFAPFGLLKVQGIPDWANR